MVTPANLRLVRQLGAPIAALRALPAGAGDHGLWLIATPGDLAELLNADPASVLPPAARAIARRRLTAAPPVAGRGLQRIEWRSATGLTGSLTFAVGLSASDRRQLLTWFAPTLPAAPPPAGSRRCLVIGAGLAGAVSARMLARRGAQVLVAERSQRSGGAVADVPLLAHHPALSGDDNARSRLSRAALCLAWRLRQLWGPSLHWCGRDQGLEGPLARYLPGWPPELLRPLAAGGERAWFARCGIAETRPLFKRLLAAPIRLQTGCSIACLEHAAGHWWAQTAANQRLGPFDAVIVATPEHAALTGLAPPWSPHLQHRLGQVRIGRRAVAASSTTGATPPGATGSPPGATATLIGGCRRDGDSFRMQAAHWAVAGITDPTRRQRPPAEADDFTWHDSRPAPRFDPIDHLPLIGAVADQAQVLANRTAHARNDRLPYPERDGLYLLTGLGGRGLLWSLLGAEMIAAQIYAEPPIVEASLATAVDPARFIRRRLRRL